VDRDPAHAVGFLILRRAFAGAAVIAVLAVAGCASRVETAAGIASGGRLAPRTIATEHFDLRAYQRLDGGGGALTVYLEGDGYAWISASRPSTDPTPKDPIALRLAARDGGRNVAWLGRPCQYTGGRDARGCSEMYWTEGRFAEQVVAATNAAIDRLKADAGASAVRLVGYSGGGSLVVLVAARRSDVELLVTVAGLLDIAAWTRSEGLSPLWRSLEPGEAAAALSQTRQVHFVGAADRDVPPHIANAFAARFPAGHRPAVVALPGYDHRCCWGESWPALLARAERDARLP